MESLMISVIMPCSLEYYPNAATNRIDKLKRAIDSFIQQIYPPKELIIVSDGCLQTIQIVKENYMSTGNNQFPKVRMVTIDKQPRFSGNVRQAGLAVAKGDIVCYLDSDDLFKAGHLQAIAEGFGDHEWVIFDDTLWKGKPEHSPRRITALEKGSCGTSNIAHKRNLASWTGCDGYGHDWQFIQKLKYNSTKFGVIDNAGYYVTHIPGVIDF